MKTIKKSGAIKHNNGKNCVAYEYPFGDKDFNFATIKLTGRYPEQGRVVNEVCKEIAHVVSGVCSLVTDDESLELAAGDTVLIDSGKLIIGKVRQTWL